MPQGDWFTWTGQDERKQYGRTNRYSPVAIGYCSRETTHWMHDGHGSNYSHSSSIIQLTEV